MCKSDDKYKDYITNRFHEYRSHLSAILVLDTHGITINNDDEHDVLCRKVEALFRSKKLKKI